MERDVLLLAAEVKQGFEALRREMEMDRENDERRHHENSHRLDLINGRVGRAHDRASALEALVSTLQARVENIATRTHERMNEIQDWISKVYGQAMGDKHGENGDADKDRLTVSRLKFYVWLVSIGAAAIVGVLKLMGKL